MTSWKYFGITGLICFGILFVQYTFAQDKIRVQGSDEPLHGRLEIWYNGQWGTVCINDGWGIEEADVVCRQLGSPSSRALSTKSVNNAGIAGGLGNPISLSNVICSGLEPSLEQCQYQREAHGCHHNHDVYVECALPGYIGCYGNIPKSWIQHYILQLQQLNIASCLTTCRNRGYLIGALHGEDEYCWCGNDGNIGGLQLSTDQCNTPCPGNDQQYCGGYNGAASVYATNLGGAIGDLNRINPNSGSLASPSFPGPYSTSVEWNLDFPTWVTIQIRMPYFVLNGEDRLLFSNAETGFPLEILYGYSEAPTYFVVGPVRQLDILLETNAVNGDALGFILFFEVLDATTRPPQAHTTRPQPQPTTKATTRLPLPSTTPPPPPSPTTRPPPPTAAPPQPPTTALPPPEPTTKVKITTKPQPQPPTQRPHTTKRHPPVPTSKRTTAETPTTKKPTTTTRRPTQPVRTTRQTARRTTIKSTTAIAAEDDSRRRFVIDWWFEVWTFICVGVFVVGMVLVSLVCWKSGKWKWLKRPRHRHHAIHRRYSSRSSWSDFYNFEPGSSHKHRREKHSDGSSSHMSSHRHHRRHRQHDSHSSWSSTWTPSQPSHRSMPSSISPSSHSSSHHGFNGSTQYLIDPNHSYPGVIYHEGYPGQGPVAYPISIPQDEPTQDPIVPLVEMNDPCPYDGPPNTSHEIILDPPPSPPSETMPPSDPIVPQEEIFDPCPTPAESIHLQDPIIPHAKPKRAPKIPQYLDGYHAVEPISQSSSESSLHSPTSTHRSFYDIPSSYTSSHGSTHSHSSSRRSKATSRSEVIPDLPAAPPPPPPPPPPAFSTIPEATPMHIVEDNCGPSDTRQIDPPSLQVEAGADSTPPPPPPPPPPPDQGFVIVPDVEPYIVAGNSDKDKHKKKKTKKTKKSKQKDKSKSNSRSEQDKRFKGFGFGKSHKIKKEQPPEPVHVLEDQCGPSDFTDRSTDAQQPVVTTIPTAESFNGDLIIPEVEPYIMAESDRQQRPTDEGRKGGKRSKVFGIGKSKKSKKKNKNKSKDVADLPDDIVIGEDEIDAVISGLDQSIRQAERAHTHSITGFSVSSDMPSPDGFDMPYTPATEFPGNYKQHVRIPSEVSGLNTAGLDLGSSFGTPTYGIPDTIPDVDEVFVAVQSADGNRVDDLSKTGKPARRDFIVPGEGNDDMPDDLNMFGGGAAGYDAQRPASLDMFNH